MWLSRFTGLRVGLSHCAVLVPARGLSGVGGVAGASYSTSTTSAVDQPNADQDHTDTRKVLSDIYQDLEHALDHAVLVQSSAEQAYLEHDPSERGPKHEYVRRYQTFARQRLEAGLQRYDQALVGDVQLPSALRLLAADSMLERDRIARSLNAPHKPDCPTPHNCTCLDPAAREQLQLRAS
eukprot:CAMPEP_0177764806 /NCGR_PEP_ID=MMETSP0491_2-20121128/7618_1 /TAXON_ID=63592 /ORGANISM="Tetraselmis chuii, Strain PLY429" /LENGTH=180 /DNA_ID=CAMNT_0019281039 /DNA_START=130 /DNA_END=672 /DNA_ORIENTATION=-